MIHKMFWNLVVVNYEKYRLHHILLFGLLLLYSLAGALVFCGLESGTEDLKNEEETKSLIRQSVAAKKDLVERIHVIFTEANAQFFNETELRKAIDKYDESMSIKPVIQKEKRWDLWGGLYYAGTIYTTIGYGDLAAETFWGRLFTMVYAVFGIPMVVTILNDWGTIMFNVANKIWKKKFPSLLQPIKDFFSTKKRQGSQEIICDSPYTKDVPHCGDPDEVDPIPLYLVVIVLMFWMGICCVVFAYLEQWSLFDTVYFFFISLTTIGFGDVTSSHRVAVANFLLILVGLSVVSMAINVVQMQLELLFGKVVQSIDDDFKMNLLSSAGDEKKGSDQVAKGDVERALTDMEVKKGDDIMKQYGESMKGGDRFLLRFMSHHQRKMIEEKFEERARMRNKWTQTIRQMKVASVQTGSIPTHPPIPEEPGEDTNNPSKSRITNKRLYIYNTGGIVRARRESQPLVLPRHAQALQSSEGDG
uniref:Ion channel n=1 Tax=Haemonchus contortus TaxID=6289 RepID=A0A7I4YYT9_HAECO